MFTRLFIYDSQKIYADFEMSVQMSNFHKLCRMIGFGGLIPTWYLVHQGLKIWTAKIISQFRSAAIMNKTE